MRPLLVASMGGLGDTIYQRPLIRHLSRSAEVWLSTPWPELFQDMPVRPVRWDLLDLRCQRKNMARQPKATWQRPPPDAREVRIHYLLRCLRTSVVEEMERTAGTKIAEWQFDLPDFFPPPVPWARYAVVRPVSVRREWMNTARNPRSEYVCTAARTLRRMGYRVICVGDLDGEKEILQGSLPEADRYALRGEFRTPELMALIQGAAVVVGAVGWIVPACLATRSPTVVVSGGLGGHNSPHLLVDRRMDASRMRFILPDEYCRCRDPRHDCTKTITDFPAKLEAALSEILSSSAGSPPASSGSPSVAWAGTP